MTPNQIVKYFGTQSEAARQLGVNRATVWQWVQRGYVPRGRQHDIAADFPELKVSGRKTSPATARR